MASSKQAGKCALHHQTRDRQPKAQMRNKNRKAGLQTLGSRNHKETCETRGLKQPQCSHGPRQLLRQNDYGFDMRALVAAQYGWISTSVCVKSQSIALLEDAHYRPPLHPFSDDGGECQDSQNSLHSLWSRCSTRSSHCATIVCCPGALTVRVNVLSDTSSLICISTASRLPVSHPLLSVHVDLKQGLAACVQSEHTPTDTAPVPVHFRFLFGTPLHHPVQASVNRRVVHHAFAARLGLACSHALSHSLCELPPLKPPLIVHGTVFLTQVRISR